MKQRILKKKISEVSNTTFVKNEIVNDLPNLNTLSSAQQTPLLIRDMQGSLVAGLFLEAAITDTLQITLRGWHFGLSELKLLVGNTAFLAIKNNVLRLDVAKELKVDSEMLGFNISTKSFTEACSLFWEVSVNGSINRYQIPLQFTASKLELKVTPEQESKSLDVDKELVSASPTPQQLVELDCFIGCKAYGWSVREGKSAGFTLNYGHKPLGQIKPNKDRQDVKDNLETEELQVGFECLLGGLIHFAAMSSCITVKFSTRDDENQIGETSLAPHISEGITFSPMKGFSRIEKASCIGDLKNLRFSSRLEASFLFEAGDDGNTYGIDFYQEDHPGRLRCIGRFTYTSQGQICNFDLRLLSREASILVVLTKSEQVIVMTDCIPLPELFSDEHLPLIDYHSLLANGQPNFDVRAKIARNYLNWQITNRQPTKALNRHVPKKDKTAVICYSNEFYDPVLATDLRRFSFLGQSCHFLSNHGEAIAIDGAHLSFAELIKKSDASHFLFVEFNSAIRPDFWSIVNLSSQDITKKSSLIHGYSLFIDGSNRPLLVKPGLLLNPRFRRHTLTHPSIAFATRASLLQALNARASDFRSSQFRIEHAFCDINISEVATIPTVLGIQRISLPPSEMSRFWSLQIPVNLRPDITNTYQAKGGVSVVINYRDSPNETIRCLEALSIQKFEDKLQIILVNNCSLESSVVSVRQRALELFPEASVVFLDYSKSFNHSAQCNLAVRHATEPFVLMLSNDAYLLTPEAILQLREVVDLPWVGTCGLRVVNKKKGKAQLSSLGLCANTAKYLFAGGSPLRTQQPPSYFCDRALEVNGNTFAAVMIRKRLYDSIGGLDEDVFPTNYNDVDFCLRVTQIDLRHIALGNIVVEHHGRGSREMDLDLPIDNRILDRIDNISKLGRIGMHWI